MGSEENKQVLYRKYRSRKLAEVIGQDHITTVLEAALRHDRIAHAFLFVGPRGVGKTSVARILAFAVNNLPYADSGHIDIIEIDAASNRRIDEIRELRDKVQIAPVDAKYKVYIIDEVHMLTREAFNALLKTLEEPPEHALFILATTEAHKIPETITSRTQRFVFRPISDIDLEKHLGNIAIKERLTVDKAALSHIARYGSGSFRDSISLLDQLAANGRKIDKAMVENFMGFGSQEQIEDLISSTLSGDVQAVNQNLVNLLSSGVQAISIAQQIIYVLRQNQPSLKSLNLIEALLSVSGSNFPHIILETELLKSALDSKSIRDETKPDISSIKVDKFKDQKTQKRGKVILNNFQELDEAQWSQLLLKIKSKNYPLYAVLRMAFVEVDESTMRFTFPFKFHARRLEDNKLISIIKDSAVNIRPKAPKIIVKVDTSVLPTSGEITEELIVDQTPKQSPDTTISTVMDAFGGGEIVEL